ncbi:MAG: hypothetical protein V4820_19285 [Pseudomonadota bacterium]|uniref:hypothetical protein n=1 Tax=Phenylobacterium sp. TaxID=1871053 RepID=UPI002716EEFC|nr:hypothetical protein [Phenylobacterium sp.]MDO9433116.1 hypothetical protein [Phenylobacterium sp.]
MLSNMAMHIWSWGDLHHHLDVRRAAEPGAEVGQLSEPLLRQLNQQDDGKVFAAHLGIEGPTRPR